MTIETTRGIPVEAEVIQNYLRNLVNLFYKILPIRESEEVTLVKYMRSFQAELLGCAGLVKMISNDALFLSLVSILQYLIDHPGSSVATYKREVFRAISMCKKLEARYIPATAEQVGEV